MSQSFHEGDRDDAAKREADTLNDIAHRLQVALFEQMRSTALKEMRKLCERGMSEAPVAPETLMEFFTILFSIVTMAGSSDRLDDGFETVQVMGKFLEHVATLQNPDSPLFSGAMTPLHPDVEQILRNLHNQP